MVAISNLEFPYQACAAGLTVLSAVLWVAGLRLTLKRRADPTRYFVYGAIGLPITLLSIAALDGGMMWMTWSALTAIAGCIGVLSESRAARKTN